MGINKNTDLSNADRIRYTLYIMLNKEQTDYIDSLRITHPSLPEATLRPLFVEAGWSAEEITEALVRYQKITPPAPPVPTPVVSSPQERPTPIQSRAPAQASPAKLMGTQVPAQTPQAPEQKKSGGLGKFLLTVGILLIICAIVAGIYFYLIQKGHINEVMRTGDIIFKSILDKI